MKKRKRKEKKNGCKKREKKKELVDGAEKKNASLFFSQHGIRVEALKRISFLLVFYFSVFLSCCIRKNGISSHLVLSFVHFNHVREKRSWGCSSFRREREKGQEERVSFVFECFSRKKKKKHRHWKKKTKNEKKRFFANLDSDMFDVI